MENFNVTIGKLTGKPSSQGWVQVYDFKPEDPNRLLQKGRIFALIATDNVYAADSGNLPGEGIDSVLAGREILARLQEEYFGTSEEKFELQKTGKINPLTMLKLAVSGVIQEFSRWNKVQIGAIVEMGNALYLVCGGGSKIYVVRDGVFVPILKSSTGETVSASGNIKDNDTFLIGTTSFFQKFAQGVIKATLQSKDVDSFSEYFAPLIHSDPTAFNSGALVLRYNYSPSSVTVPLSNRDQIEEVKEPVSVYKLQSKGPLGPNPISNIEDKVKQFFQKTLYVKQDADVESSHKRKKVTLTVGLLLLFILVVSIFFGIRQKKALDLRKKYESEISSAQHQLEESLTLFSLNPERSRELFLEARSKVLGLSDSGVDDDRLNYLKQSIQEKEGDLLGEYKDAPMVLTDLGLLSEGFRGTDFVETRGTLYVLDKNSRKIVKTVISSKRSEVIAGPSKVDKTQGLSAYGNEVYIVNEDGVFDVSGEKNKVLERLWHGDFLIGSYADNLYILEKLTSKIFRFAGTDSGFGSAKEWLSSQVSVDLKNAHSWAIDGNIWILADDGSISRFSLGNLQPFKLADRFSGINWNFIFTGDEIESLYLLDREYGRVTVFDKEGNYVAEYVSEDIKNTYQIAVSEKDKKLILLNADKLLSVDLKHLN